MTSPMNDAELLSLVAESLADDVPPPLALEAAYAAFGWRSIDADLAQLIDDAQVEVVLFRESAYSRVVTFESQHGTIELGIADDTFEASIEPRPERVVLRQPDSLAEVIIDDDDRARGRDVSGPMRLEISWPTGMTVTPWITL